MAAQKFLFCSNRALHGPWLRAMEILVREYGLDGHVIAPTEYQDSPLWEAGTRENGPSGTPSEIMQVHKLSPRDNNVDRYGFEKNSFRRTLRNIKPDYIYIQAEFWEGISHQMLSHYLFRRRHPRIIAYVAVNHIEKPGPLFIPRWPFIKRTRLKQEVLWPRLDGVCACASKSRACARRMELPARIPVSVNYLPVLGPDDSATAGARLPWRKGGDSFVIGFVGTLSPQKGWRVLLEALSILPDRFRLVVVGDGMDRDELLSVRNARHLQSRVHYAGILRQDQLLRTYSVFDVLVLPSITMKDSVEQFGAVLAEAMACGVVVIGSDSGAIPETIGNAGLVFPEGDADALANSIRMVSENESLRTKCVGEGIARYRDHYSCSAYARSVAELLQIPR